MPVPLFPGGGQELALRQPHEIAVAETPEKKNLKKQVSELVEALNFEEHMVHHKVHEVKVDAGTKVRQILKDQQDNFRRVATEYEEHARDIMTKEVAEARADVHGQAISAINDRERRIQEEHNRLNQLKDDLAKFKTPLALRLIKRPRLSLKPKKQFNSKEHRSSLKPSNQCTSRVN